MGTAIFVAYRWMDPEGEGVGELKFDCECGRQVERESAYIGNIITCECGIKYKLHVAAYVKKVEPEAPEKKI